MNEPNQQALVYRRIKAEEDLAQSTNLKESCNIVSDLFDLFFTDHKDILELRSSPFR